MQGFLTVLLYILAIALIIVVLMQPSKQDGLRGFIGGAQDTFFSRNKGRTSEVMLQRLTVVLAALIAIVTLLLHFVG